LRASTRRAARLRFAHKNPRLPAPHARWQGPTSP
jgi:hypothetical protein